MTSHSDEDFFAAIAASRAKAVMNQAKFAERYRGDTAKWRLETAEMALLARMTTRPISARALLSNAHVRAAAQRALIDALVDAFRAQPDRQWLWITMCWDTGVTWERKPDIDYVSLRSIAYRHLQRSGIEGFGMVETDVWKNFTGEPGRRMVPHVHFIGYPADERRVKVTELETEMCSRSALINSLDAPSVDIINVGKTPGDFARIGQYMSKPPAFAKNPIPRVKRPGYRLEDVEHARGSAARLIEVFSHCEIGDVMFSIGGGRDIAKKVKSAVKHEIRERPGAKPAPSRDEVDRVWRNIRKINGSKNFHPCRIITRRNQREHEK